eukprot:TRINITY_DN58987_c0_g1_i1.p1 TRINITY_DN58987_c0_g1~~TRINITY_DN58987_c0_g1_i1.p1  ORF type:complete len:447 (+),score=60.76 TRINITY_DN58987_c0_g1_i1:118-1458(+)
MVRSQNGQFASSWNSSAAVPAALALLERLEARIEDDLQRLENASSSLPPEARASTMSAWSRTGSALDTPQFGVAASAMWPASEDARDELLASGSVLSVAGAFGHDRRSSAAPLFPDPSTRCRERSMLSAAASSSASERRFGTPLRPDGRARTKLAPASPVTPSLEGASTAAPSEQNYLPPGDASPDAGSPWSVPSRCPPDAQAKSPECLCGLCQSRSRQPGLRTPSTSSAHRATSSSPLPSARFAEAQRTMQRPARPGDSSAPHAGYMDVSRPRSAAAYARTAQRWPPQPAARAHAHWRYYGDKGSLDCKGGLSAQQADPYEDRHKDTWFMELMRGDASQLSACRQGPEDSRPDGQVTSPRTWSKPHHCVARLLSPGRWRHRSKTRSPSPRPWRHLTSSGNRPASPVSCSPDVHKPHPSQAACNSRWHEELRRDERPRSSMGAAAG